MGSPYNLLASWSRLLVSLALVANATAQSYSSTANTRVNWYWPESCDEVSSQCDRFMIGGSCPITDSENSWKDRMNRPSLGGNDTSVGANEADSGAGAWSDVLRSGARSQKLMISDPASYFDSRVEISRPNQCALKAGSNVTGREDRISLWRVRCDFFVLLHSYIHCPLHRSKLHPATTPTPALSPSADSDNAGAPCKHLPTLSWFREWQPQCRFLLLLECSSTLDVSAKV